MKKTIILIIGLFVSLYAVAQEVSTNVFVAATPAGSTKLTGDELKKYLHANFKVTLVPSGYETTYVADSIIICFWDLKADPAYKKTLEEIQTRMDNSKKKNGTFISSGIETINDVRFLVWEYHNDDEVYINFRSGYNNNNQLMSGIIQFKKPDEDKAQQYLKDLLASMHFKE
jgi:hypothetical protein